MELCLSESRLLRLLFAATLTKQKKYTLIQILLTQSLVFEHQDGALL